MLPDTVADAAYNLGFSQVGGCKTSGMRPERVVNELPDRILEWNDEESPGWLDGYEPEQKEAIKDQIRRGVVDAVVEEYGITPEPSYIPGQKLVAAALQAGWMIDRIRAEVPDRMQQLAYETTGKVFSVESLRADVDEILDRYDSGN